MKVVKRGIRACLKLEQGRGWEQKAEMSQPREQPRGCLPGRDKPGADWNEPGLVSSGIFQEVSVWLECHGVGPQNTSHAWAGGCVREVRCFVLEADLELGLDRASHTGKWDISEADSEEQATGSASRLFRRVGDGSTGRRWQNHFLAVPNYIQLSCKPAPQAGEEAKGRSGKMLNFILETKRKQYVFGTNTWFSKIREVVLEA